MNKYFNNDQDEIVNIGTKKQGIPSVSSSGSLATSGKEQQSPSVATSVQTAGGLATGTSYQPCVIGVIGDSSQGKHLFLNKLAEKVIFHEVNIQFNKFTPDETTKIEIYNDMPSNSVYINLNSFHDTYILIDIWTKIENMNSNEIEKWLEEAEFVYIKSLLLLFQICNIIFLVIENLTIKSEYFLIFRILKHLKNLVTPTIQGLLSSHAQQLGLSESTFGFMTPGLSIPILQVFLVKDISEGYSLDSHLKLEDSLKKQIIYMLKNNNLYTPLSSYLAKRQYSSGGLSNNNNNNQSAQQVGSDPLFLIETNRPLVRLIRLYQINSGTINSLFQQIRMKNYSTPFNKQFTYYSQLIQSYDANQHNIPMACINSYKQFVTNNRFKFHDYAQTRAIINLLSSKIFDKNLFPIPVGSTSNGSGSNSSPSNTIMNIDLQFSNKQCQNQFNNAFEQYQEGLPSFYGFKIHNSRLHRAIKYLCQSASGPALDLHIHHLKEECEKFWKRGRRLCEKESFTGRLCTLSSHLVPPVTNLNAAIAIITTPPRPSEVETRPHSSSYKTRSSCNCGKTTRLREDVFDIELGNSLFYQCSCCEEFKSVSINSTKILYQPCKTYDRVEYNTGFSYFHITDYGSTFNVEQFLSSDSFYVNEFTLQPWEMKRIFTFSAHSGITSKYLGKNLSNYPTGKLSFEYQCPTGHKFIEKKRTRKLFISSDQQPNNTNNNNNNSTTSSPTNNSNTASPTSSSSSSPNIHVFFQRLMLESCIHPDCNYYSQLSKVYIESSIDLSVNCTVEITQHDKQPSDKWSYQMDKFIHLTKDHHYSIRLPFVFDYNNQPIQLSTPQSSTFLFDIIINLE